MYSLLLRHQNPKELYFSLKTLTMRHGKRGGKSPNLTDTKVPSLELFLLQKGKETK
jgi:hypothetical protein